MNTKKIVAFVSSSVFKVIVFAAVVMLTVKTAYTAYDYGYRIFQEPPMSTTGAGREVNVSISENMDPREMGEMLLQKGLIRDANLFVLQYHLSEFKKDLLAGEYTLSTAMTVVEMLECLTIVPEPEPEAEDETAEAQEEQEVQ